MPIVVYVLINAWQFTIYFVRDLDYKVLSETSFFNILCTNDRLLYFYNHTMDRSVFYGLMEWWMAFW